MIFKTRVFSTVVNVLRKAHDNIVILELNRPKQLNALNSEIMTQLTKELQSVEQDQSVKAVILTGCGKAFAAGADISEMAHLNYEDCLKTDFLHDWKKIGNFRKPLIAALNGYTV